MKVRTKRAKVAVQKEDASYLFEFPTPKELRKLHESNTVMVIGKDETDNLKVMELIWKDHLTGWKGVTDENGKILDCATEAKAAIWDADTSLCADLVNEASQMVKSREDLAEKN